MVEEEIVAIERNLFSHARSIVRAETAFPWHRDRRKAVTASQVVSSQALAVDVFGTIRGLPSRDRIFDAWSQQLRLPFVGPWAVELESLVSNEVLGEPTSTQLDVLARSA